MIHVEYHPIPSHITSNTQQLVWTGISLKVEIAYMIHVAYHPIPSHTTSNTQQQV